MNTAVPRVLGILLVAGAAGGLSASRPAAAASTGLSCSDPCTAVGTVLEAVGNYYQVYVDCGNGTYSAATGPSHSATLATGRAQNVIYGGADASPGTSSYGIKLYDVDGVTVFVDVTGAAEAGGTGPGYTVHNLGSCVFDPADTAGEVDSTGIETLWGIQLDSGPSYLLRHEIVTFGDSEANAGIRVTQSLVPDDAPATTDFGFRWQVDYQSGDDDGPVFATVVCDPYEVSSTLSTEQEIDPADIEDFFQMVNNDFTKVLVENFTSTSHLGNFPSTATPDRLVYGAWPSLESSDWDYVVNTGDASADHDSAVLIYFGHDTASALSATKGAATSRSVVLFNGVDAEDCGDYVPVDTGEPGDTGDTGGTVDTGEPGDTGGTVDTGEPGDTGGTVDTGTTSTDTGAPPECPECQECTYYAGGTLGCSAVPYRLPPLALLALAGVAAIRRRDEGEED